MRRVRRPSRKEKLQNQQIPSEGARAALINRRPTMNALDRRLTRVALVFFCGPPLPAGGKTGADPTVFFDRKEATVAQLLSKSQVTGRQLATFTMSEGFRVCVFAP
jgi:hypothetical protein